MLIMGSAWTLGLDTSTVVAVGIARDGEILATDIVADRMAHVEKLTPLIAASVESAGVRFADLEQIVVGLGPGPFTGLRVGIVSAQVLASVLGCPLHGVCSLDVLAAQHGQQATDFVVASDARRREVYWARYGPDGDRIGEPQVSAPDALPDLPVIGPAADLYPDQLRAVPGPRTLDPGVLALAGPALPDAGHEPLYLRRPDATESVRRKSVLHYGGGRR
jgi:tRNA threonylcarbamoyl adenosine modification protein YeaZ